jgi:hypothetical protein
MLPITVEPEHASMPAHRGTRRRRRLLHFVWFDVLSPQPRGAWP